AHNEDNSLRVAVSEVPSPLRDAIAAKLHAQKQQQQQEQQLPYLTAPPGYNANIPPARPASGSTVSSYRRGRHMSHDEALVLSKQSEPSSVLFGSTTRPFTASTLHHTDKDSLVNVSSTCSPRTSGNERPSTATLVATP